MKESRGAIDSTLAAMFSNPEYRDSYLFYAHLVGLCSIKIVKDIPAPCGVQFNIDHYNLLIRPEAEWTPKHLLDLKSLQNLEEQDFKTQDGVEMVRTIPGFDDYTLKGRLAILKHEMLHIVYDHVTGRGQGLNSLGFNFATDCAMNQHINPDHLPKDAITPLTLGKMFNINVPENKSAEFYYNLIQEAAKKKQKENKSGEGEGKGHPKMFDTHSTWEESKGDKDLQKDITKKMVERAQEETIKSQGTIPKECSQWLEMLTRKSELNWKKVLRNIVGNKRVGTRATIMRRDRRFPDRPDLRGKTKERKFNLLVVADVSGSMSNLDVISTLSEVQHICDITKTDVDLIQVDTIAFTPEKLSKKTKTIARKAQGGTLLSSALTKAEEYKLDFQAIVVLTDGGLSEEDVQCFSALNKKVIWLVCKTGRIMPSMNSAKMQVFQLK